MTLLVFGSRDCKIANEAIYFIPTTTIVGVVIGGWRRVSC